MNNSKPEVKGITIAITTFNRPFKLKRLFDSVLKSDLRGLNYEIVIIDNGSNNKEQLNLLKKLAKIKNSRVYNVNKGLNISGARNILFSVAKYNLILFLDDDVILEQKTVKNLMSSIIKCNYDAIISPIIYDYNNKNKVWFSGLKHDRWTTLGRFNYDITENRLRNSDALVTSFIFHKKILDYIKPFEELIFPIQFEELDFCVRAGFRNIKCFVDQKAVIWHDHEQAPFLINHQRLFYEIRNRIVISNLWSLNIFQFFTSRIMSLIIPLSYIFLKSALYRNNYFDGVKTIFKAIYAGLILSSKLMPYRKRDFSERL